MASEFCGAFAFDVNAQSFISMRMQACHLAFCPVNIRWYCREWAGACVHIPNADSKNKVRREKNFGSEMRELHSYQRFQSSCRIQRSNYQPLMGRTLPLSQMRTVRWKAACQLRRGSSSRSAGCCNCIRSSSPCHDISIGLRSIVVPVRSCADVGCKTH